LVREFTALVDPPYIANTATQIIDAPSVTLEPVVAAPEMIPTPPVTDDLAVGQDDAELAVKTASRKVPVPVPTSQKSSAGVAHNTYVLQRVAIPATADNQFLVKNGDNLSKIAGQHQQYIGARKISLNQMMNAIQRANPEAFIHGDRNLLKSGTIIRLPNEQQAAMLFPEDTANLLQNQWTKKIVAQPVPILSAANKLTNKPTAVNAQAAKATSATNRAINQGRLKIVPTEGVMNNVGSQSGASKSGQGQELRAENMLSQENIAASHVEITTLKNQLAEAENLQLESKRLIELQSSQIKQLTKRMQDLESRQSGTVHTAAQAVHDKAQGNTWLYSPYMVLIGLLLVAGLLGVLLKRQR
jgi:pilus assembly protein FimV